MTSARTSPTPSEIARVSWGADLPEWVAALAARADADGLKATAKAIGMSYSTVWEVLRRRYGASTDRIEERVRAALMRPGVACPVLGEIDAALCLSHQTAPFRPANPFAVRLFRACRACPHATHVTKKEDRHD